MSEDRLPAYAQYLVANKGKENTPEYRTVLQAYISARSQPQPKPEPQTMARPNVSEWGSETAAYGKQLGEKIVGAVRGPQGLPQAEQFPMGFKSVFGTSLTNDPKAQEDIVRKNEPGLQTFPLEADGKKYTIAATPDGRGGYINPPGLDMSDVSRFAAQAASFVPAAKWAGAGKSMLSRAAKGFAGGAATDVALQKGSQALGSEQPTDYADAAVVGAVGAALEPFAPMVKAGWRRVFSNKDNFNPKTGTLTENGAKMARAAGLNPDDMNSKVSKEFARVTREGQIPDDVAKRLTATSEFDLPATRGQITQDYQQMNLEDRMRRGLEGDEAKRVVTDFDKGQTEKIGEAQRFAQTQISGKKEAATRPAEAAEPVAEALTKKRDAMGRQIDDAYESARVLDSTEGIGPFIFGKDAQKEIPAKFKEALSDSVVDEVLTPASFRGLKDVQELLAKPEGLNVGTVETARRRINKYINTSTNREDKANLLKMKGALDSWTEGAIEKGLFSGDEKILRQLQQARALRADYGKLFEAPDSGGKIVSAILDKAQTPEEVVNYLFGASKLGSKSQTVSGVRKLGEVIGRDSDEWGSIKEIAWMKLSRDKQGNPLSAQAFEKGWKEALNENKSLIDELFGTAEQGLIRRYADALNTTKRESTNAPQTAFALESALRYTLRRFGQRESFTKGNVGSGAVMQFLARAPINPLGAASFARERRAVNAISPVDAPRRRAPIVPATGQAGANQTEGRR